MHAAATNAPNITDWIQAIATLAAGVASIVLLWQIRFAKDQLEAAVKQIDLAREQMKLGIRWNKLNATFTYFTNDMFITRERALSDVLIQHNIDFHKMSGPIDEQTAIILEENHNDFRELRGYLNLLEDYAAAVQVGALDKECAYALMNNIITGRFRVFEPVIKQRRASVGNILLWIELEKLAIEWEAKLKAEEQQQQFALEKIRARSEADMKKYEDMQKNLHNQRTLNETYK